MGLIYNDCMSIPLQLFGKGCYQIKGDRAVRESDQCVYPFGIDPIWMNSESDMPFYNSFKMKASVIIGIVHMTSGIVLKGLNCLHFGNQKELLHEVVPQIILLLCLFGFMDAMIIKKWLTDYTG